MYTFLTNEGNVTFESAIIPSASTKRNHDVSYETFIAITDIHFLLYLNINNKTEVFE
mgnify:FL=1